jgi:hypothetical protein
MNAMDDGMVDPVACYAVHASNAARLTSLINRLPGSSAPASSFFQSFVIRQSDQSARSVLISPLAPHARELP